MRDTFSETRSVLATIGGILSSDPPRAERVTNAQINADIDGFVRDYVRSDAWEIVVPGNHSGGISFQRLLAIQAAAGRDLFQSTIQLFQATRKALVREFAGTGARPSIAALKKSAAPAILEHVEQRLSRRGNADVLFEPLKRETLLRKQRAGRGSYPILVNTGETRAAFSRKAQVRWLK